MRYVRVLRIAGGVALLAISVSAFISFDVWEKQFLGLLAGKYIPPHTRLALMISLVSLSAPGVVLLAWRPCRKALVSLQQSLDRISRLAFLCSVLVMAGLLRLIVVVALPLHLYADWATYHQLAVRLAATGQYLSDFGPTALYPPGWPFFLSRLYLIFGVNPQYGILANVALGTGIVYLGYRLTRSVWGETPARWAAIIIAILPSQVLFVNLLCSEVLFTFLFLLSLGVVVGCRSGWENRLGRPFISGLLLGLATLVRSLTLFFPVALIPFFFRVSARRMAWVLSWATLVGGLLLVTVPWIIRNHNQVGRATISTNVGIVLCIGNNPHVGAGHDQPDSLTLPWNILANEAAADSLGISLAWACIRQDPAAFLLRGISKLAFMMSSDITGVTTELIEATKTEKWSAPAALGVSVQSCYYVFLVFVVWGIGRFFRTPPLWNAGSRLFSMTVLYWLAVHFVCFGTGRFHFPIVPLLAGFAGLAVSETTRSYPRQPDTR